MKLFVIVLSIALASCNQQSRWTSNEKSRDVEYSAYQQKIVNHQDSVSAMFMSGLNGILPKSDVSNEGHIPFFEPNENFRLEAKWEAIHNGEVFKMPTSTDRLPEYKAVGKLLFTLNEKPFELTLYQNLEHPEGLFCPFKDLTNGNESYGAGRYLDFRWQDTLNPIIDFNYCYNPYCAYNDQYSCPIPPVENHLNVRIEAGVMKWH